MPGLSEPPEFLSLAAAGTAFRSGTLSPLELTEALLARIGKLDPHLNAFVTVDKEGALTAARVASDELAAGRPRGPLHGIPVGIKDIIDVAGLPTTCHSKILAQAPPAAADAFAVARLRAEGAVILGKLATHEFAIGGPSFDLPFPPARNPWNPAHHPGGSSSGAGAGCAAGFFPAALGTDTGGSVRNPASCCGIVGLKPTYGLVSRRGVFPLSFTLDHVGPMTRTVADNATVLDAIAGFDPADPASRAVRRNGYGREIGGAIKGLRIGFVRHFHEQDLPADPAMAAALEEAARVLAAAGAEVRTVRLPSLQEFRAVNRVIMSAEAWAVHARWLRTRAGDYGALARRRLLIGAFLSAGDYVQAMQRRRELMLAVAQVLREVEVLLSASNMDPACRIDDPEALARTYPRQARTPFNVTGQPALAMMAGLSAPGLPLSLQFAARHFAEPTLYRVAAAYERASPWQQMHPPPG